MAHRNWVLWNIGAAAEIGCCSGPGGWCCCAAVATAHAVNASSWCAYCASRIEVGIGGMRGGAASGLQNPGIWNARWSNDLQFRAVAECSWWWLCRCGGNPRCCMASRSRHRWCSTFWRMNRCCRSAYKPAGSCTRLHWNAAIGPATSRRVCPSWVVVVRAPTTRWARDIELPTRGAGLSRWTAACLYTGSSTHGARLPIAAWAFCTELSTHGAGLRSAAPAWAYKESSRRGAGFMSIAAWAYSAGSSRHGARLSNAATTCTELSRNVAGLMSTATWAYTALSTHGAAAGLSIAACPSSELSTHGAGFMLPAAWSYTEISTNVAAAAFMPIAAAWASTELSTQGGPGFIPIAAWEYTEFCTDRGIGFSTGTAPAFPTSQE